MNTHTDILSTLAYFDLFNYPLKKRDIYLYLPGRHSIESFDNALTDLIYGRMIFEVGEFYSLQNNQYLSHRRKEGNKKASQMLATAEKVASFLSGFPYIRAVGVSGSLSKEFADEDSDIDLFIITKANRLWIGRTIMHAFKKLTFLFNKQHLFCMNYYIDESMLEIQEKNVYTATEVVTLYPVEGYGMFNKFYTANNWTKHFLPNNYMRIASAKEKSPSVMKRIIEGLFNNAVGNLVDKSLMKITAKRWAAKTNDHKVNNHGAIMSMHAGRHFAKPHPRFFQEQLLAMFDEKRKKVVANFKSSQSTQMLKL